MINKNILQQNIISELGLTALDDDKKIALIDKMSEVVQKRLTLKVVEQLSEDDKKEFTKILDSSPEKVAEFLQKTFPDFLELVQQEVVQLKQELVEKFSH